MVLSTEAGAVRTSPIAGRWTLGMLSLRQQRVAKAIELCCGERLTEGTRMIRDCARFERRCGVACTHRCRRSIVAWEAYCEGTPLTEPGVERQAIWQLLMDEPIVVQATE